VALWLILALLALLWGLPVQAQLKPLDVLPEAAAEGTYGLRVRPGLTTCTAPTPNTLNITTDVSGLQEACDRITAGAPAGVTTTGTTTFKAGDEIVLRGGDNYSFTVAHNFTAIIDSSLTQWAYVQDNSPVSEKSYNASFYLKLNNLSFANNTDRLHHFVGYASDGTPWLRIVLRKHSSGEKRLILEARKDDTDWASTEGVNEAPLPDGYNEIEIEWSAGSGNGKLQATVNGGSPWILSSTLNNSNAQIDHIKWGAVGTHTSIDGIGGYLDVDHFSSWR
jgi:hypothetical protein